MVDVGCNPLASFGYLSEQDLLLLEAARPLTYSTVVLYVQPPYLITPLTVCPSNMSSADSGTPVALPDI